MGPFIYRLETMVRDYFTLPYKEITFLDRDGIEDRSMEVARHAIVASAMTDLGIYDLPQPLDGMTGLHSVRLMRISIGPGMDVPEEVWRVETHSLAAYGTDAISRRIEHQHGASVSGVTGQVAQRVLEEVMKMVREIELPPICI